MRELELDQFAFAVESHAERFAAEMTGEDADRVRRAVKLLNDAVEDNDVHGTAVFARVLRVLTNP